MVNHLPPPALRQAGGMFAAAAAIFARKGDGTHGGDGAAVLIHTVFLLTLWSLHSTTIKSLLPRAVSVLVSPPVHSACPGAAWWRQHRGRKRSARGQLQRVQAWRMPGRRRGRPPGSARGSRSHSGALVPRR